MFISCDGCAKEFSWSSSVRSHRAFKPTTHRFCPLCGFRYGQELLPCERTAAGHRCNFAPNTKKKDGNNNNGSKRRRIAVAAQESSRSSGDDFQEG